VRQSRVYRSGFHDPAGSAFRRGYTLVDTERDGHRVAFNTAFHEAGLDWEWMFRVAIFINGIW